MLNLINKNLGVVLMEGFLVCGDLSFLSTTPYLFFHLSFNFPKTKTLAGSITVLRKEGWTRHCFVGKLAL